MSNLSAQKIKIADKFQFLFKPKRIKVAFGGRGGAKTVSFTKAAILLAGRDNKKFLCLREFMNSIEDSVHSALTSEIIEMGVDNQFKIKASSIDLNGNPAFRYGQLARNLASIKSKHAYDVAWVEEAESISHKSLDTLIPTIRKSGSEIWFSLNPVDEFGAVYSEFIKPHLPEIERNGFYEDDELYVVKVGLDDNPFAPQELIDASTKMKRDNYTKWLHVYGGACMSDYDDSIIRPEWVNAAVDAHIKLNFKAVGVKVLGFDPADSGNDDKAVAFRHGSVVSFLDSWGDGELPDAIDKAFQYAYDQRADVIIYDGDGLGAGVKVGLDERVKGKAIDVQSYKGGMGVDNPDDIYSDEVTNGDSFRNKRAQYWWLLRDRFEATYNAVEFGVYSDPENLISLFSGIDGLNLLKAELVRPQRKRTNNSIIQLESKADMKKRGMPSPNLADALVMCFANTIPDFKKGNQRPNRSRRGAMAA